MGVLLSKHEDLRRLICPLRLLGMATALAQLRYREEVRRHHWRFRKHHVANLATLEAQLFK
jgi:hypothetical protein